MRILKIKILIIISFFPFISYAAISEIKNLQTNSFINEIVLQWDRIALEETEAVFVIRKENECPVNNFNGKEIYHGNGNKFSDKNVGKNMYYCYGVFVGDFSGNYSQMKTTGVVKTKSFIENTVMLLEKNLFIFSGLILILFLYLYRLNLRKHNH